MWLTQESVEHPTSCCDTGDPVCADSAIFEAAPSGVIGRKLDKLELSAVESIVATTVDGTDEVVELAKLVLPLPDILFMYL